MRKFIVNVNGTSYEVEVEEISGAQAAAPAAQPVPAEKAEPAPVSAPASAADPGMGESVTAPMPGNILEVKVQAGSAVRNGDVLLILEAMKMENEILAPRDGKVLSVGVTKGATVNAGDLLCVIG